MRNLALAFLILTFLAVTLSCSEKKNKNSSSSQAATEAEVQVAATEPAVRLRHGEQMANAIISALGVTDSTVVDSVYDRVGDLRTLFSESDEVVELTGGYLNAVSSLAELACEGYVYRQERSALEIDTRDSLITDSRKVFKYIWLQPNPPNSSQSRFFDSQTQELVGGNVPRAQSWDHYRLAAKRLARKIWGRDLNAEEESNLIELVQTIQAGASSAAGYRSAVAMCSAMFSSMEFIKQ